MAEEQAYDAPGGLPQGGGWADSCHEVTAVMAEVGDCSGPRTLVIVAIVSTDSQSEIQERCKEYNSGSVFVETELSFASRIRTLAESADTRRRLNIIASPVVETLSIQIPSQFRKVSITACEKERTFLNFGTSQTIKELVLEDDSTYCNIALSRWSERTQFTTHEFITCPGVVLELPDDDILDGDLEPPPFTLQSNDDVEDAARYIEREITTPADSSVSDRPLPHLPWIAGLAGVAAGVGTAGVLLVSSIEIGVKGLFISAGPYGYAGVGSLTLKGALVATGSIAVTSVVVGASAAAAVYFIPWRKLASWFLDAFSHFLGFLKSIWNKIKEGLSFLKKVLTMMLLSLQSLGLSCVGAAAKGLSSMARMVTGFGMGQPIQLS